MVKNWLVNRIELDSIGKEKKPEMKDTSICRNNETELNKRISKNFSVIMHNTTTSPISIGVCMLKRNILETFYY